jgi:hypothetical protein
MMLGFVQTWRICFAISGFLAWKMMINDKLYIVWSWCLVVFRRKLIHLCQRFCFFPSAQVWAEQHWYLFLLKVYRTLCHFVTTIKPCSSPTQHTSTNQSAHFRCLSHHKTCQWQVRRRIPSSALEPLRYARSAVEFHSHHEASQKQ